MQRRKSLTDGAHRSIPQRSTVIASSCLRSATCRLEPSFRVVLTTTQFIDSLVEGSQPRLLQLALVRLRLLPDFCHKNAFARVRILRATGSSAITARRQLSHGAGWGSKLERLQRQSTRPLAAWASKIDRPVLRSSTVYSLCSCASDRILQHGTTFPCQSMYKPVKTTDTRTFVHKAREVPVSRDRFRWPQSYEPPDRFPCLRR